MLLVLLSLLFRMPPPATSAGPVPLKATDETAIYGLVLGTVPARKAVLLAETNTSLDAIGPTQAEQRRFLSDDLGAAGSLVSRFLSQLSTQRFVSSVLPSGVQSLPKGALVLPAQWNEAFWTQFSLQHPAHCCIQRLFPIAFSSSGQNALTCLSVDHPTGHDVSCLLLRKSKDEWVVVNTARGGIVAHSLTPACSGLATLAADARR